VEGKQIILGVSGGIAAYKVCEVASKLVQAGAQVYVIMTENAQQFVGAKTLEALTRRPVITSMFAPIPAAAWEQDHVSLTDTADLLLIAPATANVIGKLANGVADDMLSTTALAFAGPTVIAPAMNLRMWAHPAVQRNVAYLRELGVELIGPEEGRLASGAVGLGRMSEPQEIVARVREMLESSDELGGARVLVTAGPSREWWDDVRFLSNASSGKMGYALAEVAARRGAQVTLVSGPTALPTPRGVGLVRVETAEEMAEAATAGDAVWDIAICAAAPADWRPQRVAGKIRKDAAARTVELIPTRDTLRELGHEKRARVLVGFAAETEGLIEHAQQKARAKRADFIVANDVSQVGAGFGGNTNIVTVVWPDGRAEPHPLSTKREVAERVLDEAAKLWRERRGG
jgi:phosphopantothenoylcysteine decarboxylase/phosphopantothenate--cysteine ligase